MSGSLDESPNRFDVNIVSAFYSPFDRAWEFGIGSIIALALSARSLMSSRLWDALGYVGLLMVAWSLWLINGSTPFPSTWTLLPVGGAALIILSGSQRKSGVSAGLSLKPLVRIGDWSYSLYLWHWPLLVLAALLWPMAPGIAIVAALVSVAAARRHAAFKTGSVRTESHRGSCTASHRVSWG